LYHLVKYTPNKTTIGDIGKTNSRAISFISNLNNNIAISKQ